MFFAKENESAEISTKNSVKWHKNENTKAKIYKFQAWTFEKVPFWRLNLNIFFVINIKQIATYCIPGNLCDNGYKKQG